MPHSHFPTRFAPALLSLFVTFSLFSSLQAQDDADARAQKIVAQMTLDEKISQLHGTQTKGINRIVIGLPRLGIPDLIVTNGAAGFGPAGPGHEGKATALPAPIALAATWDVEAAHDYGVIEGTESLDWGNTFLEAPTINIARVPQNGRTFEGYGEDPYLVGRLAVANILAIQSQGIIANVKHYAANNQETDRHSVNSVVDERTLREIYLPAFEASVKEGHVGSAMAAYNRVNGVYCCQNDELINQIMKKEWGFDGFVSSDFWAVQSTIPSVMGGLDLEMPAGKWFDVPLKAAVDSGKVPLSVIDEHLVRRFRTMMKFGVWDHLPVIKPIPVTQNGEIARRLAEEGMVLLRNEDHLLPLDDKIKSVALIGPYAGQAMTGGGGSSHVDPAYKITPLEGLQKRLGPGVKITLNDGKDIASAVAEASGADVAIVMLGDSQTESKDHPVTLASNQDALVAAVANANKRTVIVVKSGGPILMPWANQVPAILESWYPGEEDGNAVAAVLTGDWNPSGKLPITFAKSLDDVPAHTPEQYPGTGPSKGTDAKYSEGILVGYRWYDAQKIEPLFPFGFGLSYTSFAYRNLKLSTANLTANNPTLGIDFDIADTGTREGAEVGQVYLGLPSLPDAAQPPHALKGFVRLNIKPGETGHGHVDLGARAFSYWDVTTHGWKIAPGTYTVYVGGSSRDLPLQGQVTVQ